LARHDASGCVAGIGAVEAEANAAHHVAHVILGEIGVGTARTAGAEIEAPVDTAQKRVAIQAGRLWMQLDDLLERHVPPLVRAALEGAPKSTHITVNRGRRSDEGRLACDLAS